MNMSQKQSSPLIPSILIFTDGACSGNPGPGGWGSMTITPSGQLWELGARVDPTTNNRMELTACIATLKALQQHECYQQFDIHLYSDSHYVIQGITQWIFTWKNCHWKTRDGKPVANQDLWESLWKLNYLRKIDWQYVPAHSDYAGNQRVDKIAVAFSKDRTITLFQGHISNYSIPLSKLWIQKNH